MSKTKDTVHICSKEKEIENIKQELIHSNKKLDEIHKWLLGNGKKGLLDEMAELRGAFIFA
jgi:hypothetical protein